MTKIKKWNTLHAVFLLLCSITVIGLQTLSIFSLISFVSFTWFYVSSGLFRCIRGKSGYANDITLIRLILTLVTGFSYPVLSDLAVAILALIIVSMDVVDGYLARRFSSESTEGKYFDMETDALYVCVMCSLMYLKGYVGIWILLTGFMRYIYVVILMLLGLTNREERLSRVSRYIAGILFCSVITPFFFEKHLYIPVVAGASLLVLISFSSSFIRLINSKNEI